MSAVRLARGFTGRNKVLMFEGGYHGHSDGLLAKAGSGLATLSLPGSAGVSPATAADTLLARYNDLSSVDALLDRWGNDVACILVEPVAGNMGVVPPADGFLAGLRERADAIGALLIFDEVITGFRVAWGGAQERFGVTPDLTTLGKIIGGRAAGGRLWRAAGCDGTPRPDGRRLPGGDAVGQSAGHARRAGGAEDDPRSGPVWRHRAGRYASRGGHGKGGHRRRRAAARRAGRGDDDVLLLGRDRQAGQADDRREAVMRPSSGRRWPPACCCRRRRGRRASSARAISRMGFSTK